MVRYSKYSRIFLAPDAGGGSGGGSQQQSGNPAASQAGGVVDEGSSDFKDPTAGLNLDDLDPEVRKVVEDSRKGFAALQKQAADNKAAAAAEEARRKDFQSNYDKLRNQVDQLTNAGVVNQDDPHKVTLNKFMQILIKRGVAEPQAKVQAEIMLELMQDFGGELKKQIGADLMPFAATVVTREAESSWHQAVAMDRVGAFSIPEIAEHVWAQITEMAGKGQQVNPMIVQNLAGMAYFAHLQKGGAPANSQQTPPVQQQQQPPTLPNVGRLTYPGAGAQPQRVQQYDPNAAKTVLDADTDAALQSVFKTWAKGQGGIKAPGYRESAKKGH